MAKKKIDLLFNFGSEVPGPGDPNEYRNLAPGAKPALAEQLKNSLRAERFTTYEKTFKQISDLFGSIEFKDFNLASKDQNVGGVVEALRSGLAQANDRIDSGSFPVREVFGTGVFRSYEDLSPESTAIAHYEPKLSPGEVEANPEFEIIKIKDHTITLVGGKALTPTSVASYPTENAEYDIDVAAPNILKNTEFDSALNVYPKEAHNRVKLTWDGSGFVGKIPVIRASNGLPIRLPIEPGQFSGTGNDKLDIAVLWEETADRVLSDSSTNPADRDIKILYNNDRSEEIYIKIKPSVFLAANSDPGASDSSKTLTIYVYYYYAAWRVDAIEVSTTNISITSGKDETEISSADPLKNTILYEVLVSCWDEDATKLRSSANWTLISDIQPYYPNGSRTDQGFYRTNIIDKRVFVNGNRTAKADWKNRLRNKLIPRNSSIANAKGRVVRAEQLRTDYGDFLIVKNKAGANINTGYRLNLVKDTFVEIKCPPDLFDSNFDSTKPFLVGGVSFLLCKQPNVGSVEEVKELADPLFLEYQVLDEGNLILQGKTRYPQAGLPESVSFYEARPISVISSANLTLKVKIANSNSSDTYFICGEDANQIGRSISFTRYSGLGLRNNKRQFELLSYKGSSVEVPVISSGAFVQDGSKVGSISDDSYPFLNGSDADGYTTGNLSFTHNTANFDVKGDKYITVNLGVGVPGDPSYQLKSQQNLSLTGVADLNSSSNISYIIESQCIEKGGLIQFAILMGFNSGILNESTEKCVIVVGSIVPRLAQPVVVYKTIGSINSYNSQYGLTTFLVRSSNFYSTKGRQLALDADDEGNSIVAFLGKKLGTSTDTLDVFSLDRAKNLRGTYRSEELVENLKVKAVCTAAYTGQHTGIVITKRKISANTSIYNLSLMIPDDHNEKVETKLQLLNSLETSFTTQTNDDDQTDICAVWSFDEKLRVLYSTTDGLSSNNIAIVDYLINYQDSLRKVSTYTKTVSEFPRDLDYNQYYLDSNTAIISGKTSGNVLTAAVIRGERYYTVSGRTATTNHKLLAKNKILAQVFDSSNYVTTPFCEVDYLFLTGSDYPQANTDKETISIEGTGDLFLGHYIDSGEFFTEEPEQPQNLILDPVMAHDRWSVGPVSSLVTITDNDNYVSVPAGQVLRYSLDEYTHDAIFLARLAYQVVCVAYDVDHTGGAQIGNRTSITMFDGASHQFPILKVEEGFAWFYIDQPVANSLYIQFNNRSAYIQNYYWATAVVGWKPLVKVDQIDWVKKTRGEIKVEDTSDATSSSYLGQASMRTKGGISAEKQIRSGSDITAAGNINAGSDLNSGGNATIGGDVAAAGSLVVDGSGSIGTGLDVLTGQAQVHQDPVIGDDLTRKSYVDYWDGFYGKNVGEIFYREELFEPTVDRPYFRLTQPDKIITSAQWGPLVEFWRAQKADAEGVTDFHVESYLEEPDGAKLFLRNDHANRVLFEGFREDYRYHQYLGGTVANWKKTLTLPSAIGGIAAGEYYVTDYGFELETKDENQGSIDPTTSLYLKGYGYGTQAQIVDSSPGHKTVGHQGYLGNGGGVSSGQAYTGSQSYYFDTNNELVVEDSADLNFGTGDFTLEAYVRPALNQTAQGFLRKGKYGEDYHARLCPISGAPKYVIHAFGSYWFTLSGSNVVRRIHETTHEIQADISTGGVTQPWDLVSDGTSVWVTLRSSNQVAKINPNTNTVTTAVTVGGDPVGIAYAGGFIWSTNIVGQTVSKIDTGSNTVSATITFPGGTGPNKCVGGTNYLYVGAYTTGKVYKIDLVTNALGGSPVTVGTQPTGLCVAFGYLWVVHDNNGVIEQIDMGTDTVSGTVDVSALSTNNQDIEASDDSLFLTSVTISGVMRIDPVNLVYDMKTYNSMSSSYGMCIAGNEIVVVDTGYPAFWVLNTKVAEQMFNIGSFSGGWAIISDGTYLWAVASGTASIKKFNPATNKLVATLALPTACYAVAYDGSHIWATDSVGALYKIDPAGPTLVGTTSLGTDPIYSLFFDGTNLWGVAYASTSHLYKINQTTGAADATYAYASNSNMIDITDRDTNYLWVTAENSHIYKIHKATGEIHQDMNVAIGNTYSSVWDGTYLWTVSYSGSNIAKIDPSNPNGYVLKQINTYEGTPRKLILHNGVIYAAIYNSGSNNAWIIELRNDGDFQLRYKFGTENVSSNGAFALTYHGGKIWILGASQGFIGSLRLDIQNNYFLTYDGVAKRFAWVGGSYNVILTSKTSPAALQANVDTWHHVAVTRKDGITRLFVNHILQSEIADNTDYTSTDKLRIGSVCLTGAKINCGITGYVDAVKISKGLARYDVGDQWTDSPDPASGFGDFTPRKRMWLKIVTPNLIDPSVVLFVSGQGTAGQTVFKDSSSRGREVLRNFSDVVVSDLEGYNGTTSLLQTSDFLHFDSSEDWNFGTGDFTIEGFFLPTVDAQDSYLVSRAPTYQSLAAARIYGILHDGNNHRIIWNGNGGGVTLATPNNSVKRWVWNHFAVVRESGVIRIYLNFSLVATIADTTNYNSSTAQLLLLGGENLTYNLYDGFFSGFKIWKGVAAYTGSTITAYDRRGIVNVYPHRIPGYTDRALHIRKSGTPLLNDQGKLPGFRRIDSANARGLIPHTHSYTGWVLQGFALLTLNFGDNALYWPTGATTGSASGSGGGRESIGRGSLIHSYIFAGEFNP